MKLAITVNCMELFVKGMYNLEGGGLLALEVYKRLRAFYIAITDKDMPNVKQGAILHVSSNS